MTGLSKEDAMTPISMLGLRGVLIATAVIAAAALIEDSQLASAQDDIICKYGSARYRSCCTESLRRSPNLSARARANDIDACINRRSQNPPEEKTPPAETVPRKNPPAQPAASTDRGEAGARIRRIDCASGGCSVGCGSDEMAISAFCTVGSYPTINADQSVRCSNSAGVEWPTVLFCAKK
jgi:hypothetical protein